MAANREKLQRLAGLVLVASVSAAVAFGADTPPASSTADSKPVHHTIHHRKSHKPAVRGQKAIDGDRARQIQQALIHEHYMNGEPTGKWDATTQQAMQRYQADQGWQSKNVPDSRALIRLGLGPDNQHLLNPESAMTTVPDRRPVATSAASAPETSSSTVSMPASSAASPSSSSGMTSGETGGMADSPAR